MRHVAIFARRPQLGRVKSRLAADIGSVEALRFYRTTLGTVTRRLAAGRGWTTWLAVTPDDAVADGRGWPRGIERLPQGGGDLGHRMAGCLALFGPEPAIIVGSDIPDLTRHHVARAFDLLRRHDFVFGPAADGGYWLVGAAQGRRTENLFRDVRWSGLDALTDTMGNAGPAARIALLDPLDDIDDGAAYRRWRQRD